MKRFYVTFGMGSLLRGYHCIFEAMSEDIVRVYMNKKAKIAWSNIYTEEPNHSKALRPEPESLFYENARHIA